MRNKRIIYALSLVAAGFLSSCDKVSGDEPLEMTKPGNLAGEWFVTIKLNGTDVGGGYDQIMTYNTSDNSAAMWVDGLKRLDLKSKVTVNISELTFACSAADNLVDTAAKVTITNGKVIPKGGKSANGAVVDSIYFETAFSNDPGNKYIISGHQRSGFPTDEL